MKLLKILGILLLCSIISDQIMAQSSLILSFDGTFTGEEGEQPSLYNYTFPLDFVEGVINQAAYFPDGNRLQFLADGNINDLEGTIYYWINTSWFAPAEHCLFQYGNNNDYMKIRLTENNEYQFIIRHNFRELELSMNTDEWEPETWHLIAHTWNSKATIEVDAIRLFFDGNLAAVNETGESADLIQAIGGEFQIGADGTQHPLEASLDQFTILDHELSESEIRAIYNEHPPVQNSYNLLLDFENNVLGNCGEEPTENNATSFVRGKFGEAIHFNPQNTLVYPFEGNIHPRHGALSCWVSPNWSGNPNHTLFQIDDGSEFFVGSDENGDFKFRIGNPAEPEHWFVAEFETSLLHQQNWSHLTFTWDYRAGTTEEAISIYLNGSLLAQNTTGTAPWGIPSISGETIQLCGSGSQKTFSGVIDRFFILADVPTLENIQYLMNGYYPAVENMQFFSNTDIRLMPGNYSLPDINQRGVIRIQNVENFVLDGTGFQSTGDDEDGIFLYLENCNGIEIKNFESISNYFYGIKMTGCNDIQVNNCNISDNKKDMNGWINIWEGPDNAHGGGIFMQDCSGCTLTNSTLSGQNDGVAAYSCSRNNISDNNCSDNTGYGIRLFYSDNNNINNNNCSNINRNTDPSDCASILMFFCSNDTVTNNDFSYSGDGIFINDNKTLANARQDFAGGNNYFTNNDCSYSLHNAIEAVFSSGNVFVDNTCSFSQYGFWLGYSQETIVKNNTINHNKAAGIAIDRGSSNLIDGNIIRENLIGTSIWQDDSPISGYSDYESKDYELLRNYFIGNSTGSQLANTSNVYLHQNLFITNLNAIKLLGFALNDTLTNNRFSNTVGANFMNLTQNVIIATNNSFGTNDEAVIECKIQEDDDNQGSVIWQPFAVVTDPEVQILPPDDLAERSAEWISFTEDGELSLISWDQEDYIEGNESVKLTTGSGSLCKLHYTPGNLIQAGWDLSKVSEIVFNIKINKTSGQQLQRSYVLLADECLNPVQYTNQGAELFNNCTDWTKIRIPIAGNNDWIRSGNSETLNHITFIQLAIDTWGMGFELWLDGFHFEYQTGIEIIKQDAFNIGNIYPNPAHESIIIPIKLSAATDINVTILDLLGHEIHKASFPNLPFGYQELNVSLNNIPPGNYIMEVSCTGGEKKRMVLVKNK